MFNIDGNYLDFNEKDILDFLNKDELIFYKSGCKVKSNDDFSKWLMFYTIQSKIIDAYKEGKLKSKEREIIVPRFAPYVISDSLGVQGIVSQSDGKSYDSKSIYYNALKAQGMVVMGSDAPTTKATPKTQEIDWKQAVAETIKSTPAKGKEIMAKKEEISIEEEIRNSLNEKLDDNEVIDEEDLEEVEETTEEEAVEESEFKEAEEKPVTEEAPVVEEDNDPAPVSLSGAIKEKWRELPADVRAEWKKREDDIHRQMTAQDGDLAVGRKIKEIASPYEQIIREEGGTIDGAFKDMMHTSYILRKGSPQQKAEAVMHAIQQFNIDMSPYFNQGQQQDQNAQFKALQEEIKYLREQANPQAIKSQLQEEIQRDTITSEIQAFAANPENVHFEAVKPIMGSLIASGRAKNLQEAYEMAIYADPSIRSELDAKSKQAEAEKKKAEMAAKKKASLSVSGSHGASPNANAPQKSIEEDIREQMRASLGKI